ncbi:hypothetical protein GA0115261_110337 [Streptomyces sp. OspMP-M43]|nr:hypothetical protein GA0115261_110337 [Streptomyces sp. OspMP-M43]
MDFTRSLAIDKGNDGAGPARHRPWSAGRGARVRRRRGRVEEAACLRRFTRVPPVSTGSFRAARVPAAPPVPPVQVERDLERYTGGVPRGDGAGGGFGRGGPGFGGVFGGPLPCLPSFRILRAVRP